MSTTCAGQKRLQSPATSRDFQTPLCFGRRRLKQNNFVESAKKNRSGQIPCLVYRVSTANPVYNVHTLLVWRQCYVIAQFFIIISERVDVSEVLSYFLNGLQLLLIGTHLTCCQPVLRRALEWSVSTLVNIPILMSCLMVLQFPYSVMQFTGVRQRLNS